MCEKEEEFTAKRKSWTQACQVPEPSTRLQPAQCQVFSKPPFDQQGGRDQIVPHHTQEDPEG